jgi:hypothetical protein
MTPKEWITGKGYIYWMIVILVIILTLWVFWGGENVKYVGITYSELEKGGIINNKYTYRNLDIDNTPDIPQFRNTSLTEREIQEDRIAEQTYQECDIELKSAKNFLDTSESDDDIQIPDTVYEPIIDSTNGTNGKNYSHSKSIRNSLRTSKLGVRKECKRSIKEAECKRILEKMFGVTFKTVRPRFLRNPETGRNLEIDCYNHDLRLGIEYNGKQHYVFPNGFHKNIEIFNKQVYRDALKLKLCDEAGVYLISVPYNVHIRDIAKYIEYNLPPDLLNRSVCLAE